jgi:hypothetical protein
LAFSISAVRSAGLQAASLRAGRRALERLVPLSSNQPPLIERVCDFSMGIYFR